MSSKTVAAVLWWSLLTSASAGPVAVGSCELRNDTAAGRSGLSDLNRLSGRVLTTESNGNVYFVSICRPIPNAFYDPRKQAGAVKFTTEGHSIDLGRIDQTDVVVNEDSIVLTYVGGDKDTNSKDACRGRRWHTYLTFICDPSANIDVLTLINEDPDQPVICQVWFEIKTTKTCVRQPNVPLNALENDLIKQNASAIVLTVIENGKNIEKWEEIKANQIPSGDESFNNEIGKFNVSKNAPNNKIEESVRSNQNHSRDTISEYMPFVKKYLNVINEYKSKDKDNKDENSNMMFETRTKTSDYGNGVNSRYVNAENTSSKNETDGSVNGNKFNTTVNAENQTFNRENNNFEMIKKHSDDGNKEPFGNDVSSKYENQNFWKENKSVNYEYKNTVDGNSFNNENVLNTTNNLHRNSSQNTNADSEPLSNKNDKENKPTSYEINTNNSNTITVEHRSANNAINDFTKRSENGNEENARNTIAEYKSSRNENDNSINETGSSNRENKEVGSNTTTGENRYAPRNENAINAENTDSQDKWSKSEKGSAKKSVNDENREDDSSNDNSTIKSDSSDVEKRNRSDNKPTETGVDGKNGKNGTNGIANKTDDSSRSTRDPTTTKAGNNDETTAAAVVESSTNRLSNATSDRTEIENPPSGTAANSTASSTTVNDNSTIKSDSSDVEKRNRSDSANGKSSGNRSDNKPTETGAAGKNGNANKTDDSSRSTRDPTTTKAGNNDETTATAVVESSTNRLSNTTSDRTEIENPPSGTTANSTASSTTVNDKSPSTGTVNKTKNVTPTTGRAASESDRQTPSNTSSRLSNAVDDGSNNVPADVPSDANGTRLSAATIMGGLGLLSVFCAVAGTAVNRYYYKLTGTDQIPFKGTFQSVYSHVKAFVTKTFCCCVGGPTAVDVTDEKTSLLQPKYVPGEEKTSRKSEKHQTSSDDSGKRQRNENNDDKNNTNGYGSMSNEKHSPTAGKKYRKKRSKSKSARVDLSDSGPDNVMPSKLLKTEDSLQGKPVKDVINEKLSTIMNTKIKPAIKNIFGKTEKKFENADTEEKEENVETTSNEPSFLSRLMGRKSAKNDDDGGRVDENTGTDITEFPIKITEDSERQSFKANPNNGDNVKSSSGFDVIKEQDDSENSKDKLINKLVEDLDSIRFELDTEPEIGANKSVDSGGAGTVNTDKRETNQVAAADDKPWVKNVDDATAMQGFVKNGKKDETPNGSGDDKAKKQAAEFGFVRAGAGEEEEHAQMRKERSAERSDVRGRESADDDDDGSIEIIEEIVYVDAESGEDGEEIVEEITETVTVGESPEPSDAFDHESAEPPSVKASTTVVRKTSSSSAAPGHVTGDTVLPGTTGADAKKPFGFQLGIGKSGVNVSVGAKQLGIGRSGVKFGKKAEAEGDGRGAMTIKLDKSGLRLNRDKKNAPRTSGETGGPDDANPTATSARKKSKPNFAVFKRSVSQPIGSDVREAEGDDGPAASGVVAKKQPSRSSAGLLKFGRSRSKSTGVMETDDEFTTDPDVLSSFIGHERYASSLSVDDVPDSDGAAGRRANVTASSPDSASASSSFDRHGVLGDDIRLSAPGPKDGKDDGDRRPTKPVDNKSNVKSKLNKFKKHTLNR